MSMDALARPTVAELHGDNHFVQLARNNWPASSKPISRAQPDFLKTEIWDHLEKEDFSNSSVLLLENLQLLERYLWPSFTEDSSNHHVLLIVLLLNAKKRESLPTWSLFTNRPADFSSLFRRILTLALDTSQVFQIRCQVLANVIGAFQSLDQGLIRKECAPLVSIAVWHNLRSDSTRNELLERYSQFKKAWRATTKKYDAADDEDKVRLRYERSWLYTLLLEFLDLLYDGHNMRSDRRLYCERFMEFLTDLQSQFPTRRYVNTLLKDLNILVAVNRSPLYQSEDGGLFRDFCALLRHYIHFPIDDHTGRQISMQEVSAENDARIARLQRTALKHFKEKLNLLALANYSSLGSRAELESHLDALNDQELFELAELLGFRTDYSVISTLKVDRSFVMNCLLSSYEKRPPFQKVVKEMSLLPTEQVLYDSSFTRNEAYDGNVPLALPKLNLQYLTVGDFLWRSFILCRCESFFEIKRAMEDTAKKLQPGHDSTGGRDRPMGSKMALQISRPGIVEKVAPKVGEKLPAEVRAEIILDVSRLSPYVRREWEELRPSDTVYLLALDQSRGARKALTNGVSSAGSNNAPFRHLRVAEVSQMLDENGKPLRVTDSRVNGYHSRSRQLRLIVKLDSQAFHEDEKALAKGKADVYDSINYIVRRRKRENNFKSVLESIRNLAVSKVQLPPWLQDVFLGMGDPSGASYQSLPNALRILDFRDTFLDWDHLRESLPTYSVQPVSQPKNGELGPPFVLTEDGQMTEEEPNPSQSKRRRGAKSRGTEKKQNEGRQTSGKQDGAAQASPNSSKKRSREEMEDSSTSQTVRVSSYNPPNTGPYPVDAPKPNRVRFTPAQVEAIKSGTQPGLTVVVGPPGTGKTDVATQIINNIYHNFPSERILLVAHSNQALNQLFQKIVALDIDDRHLLRLGHGEEDLQLEGDASFSRHGRVEHFLERGSWLLSEVARLAASIRAPGAHGQSCETAEYFNAIYVQPIWQRYVANCEQASSEEIMRDFPFHDFFTNAPRPMFEGDESKDEALEIARGGYRHIQRIFAELADIRPFEVLRNDRLKANYLLVKEARIIAMTSTYAAMRQQEIADLGFEYDNVVMEEAAQIKEIENFIPLALQKPKNGENTLKRVVMCGDHLQNSPIVQSSAFRQYANLEQSLFLRLVRLGVPSIMLDRQGRARSSIAELTHWRYPSLGNLPAVEALPEFQQANAGLRYDYQFINVPDYKGRGETTPSPHFIQNLGEAEYAVALYMYMRLLGYPASKISILTPYAGQRALIRDVLGHRCAKNRLFGLPRIVTTVDKYQGEQNNCKYSWLASPSTSPLTRYR